MKRKIVSLLICITVLFTSKTIKTMELINYTKDPLLPKTIQKYAVCLLVNNSNPEKIIDYAQSYFLGIHGSVPIKPHIKLFEISLDKQELSLLTKFLSVDFPTQETFEINMNPTVSTHKDRGTYWEVETTSDSLKKLQAMRDDLSRLLEESKIDTKPQLYNEFYCTIANFKDEDFTNEKIGSLEKKYLTFKAKTIVLAKIKNDHHIKIITKFRLKRPAENDWVVKITPAVTKFLPDFHFGNT